MSDLTREMLRILAALIFGVCIGGVITFLLFYFGHITIYKGGDWIKENYDNRISEYDIQKISKED